MSPPKTKWRQSLHLEIFVLHCLMLIQIAKLHIAYTQTTITTNSSIPEEIIGEGDYWLSVIQIQNILEGGHVYDNFAT